MPVLFAALGPGVYFLFTLLQVCPTVYRWVRDNFLQSVDARHIQTQMAMKVINGLQSSRSGFYILAQYFPPLLTSHLVIFCTHVGRHRGHFGRMWDSDYYDGCKLYLTKIAHTAIQSIDLFFLLVHAPLRTLKIISIPCVQEGHL